MEGGDCMLEAERKGEQTERVPVGGRSWTCEWTSGGSVTPLQCPLPQGHSLGGPSGLHMPDTVFEAPRLALLLSSATRCPRLLLHPLPLWGPPQADSELGLHWAWRPQCPCQPLGQLGTGIPGYQVCPGAPAQDPSLETAEWEIEAPTKCTLPGPPLCRPPHHFSTPCPPPLLE